MLTKTEQDRWVAQAVLETLSQIIEGIGDLEPHGNVDPSLRHLAELLSYKVDELENEL
jgi:hypothetical protein